MKYSVSEAKNRLPELLKAFEEGEEVVITRHGKPIAQLSVPVVRERKVQFDTMKDVIRLLPGWDDPITEEEFLGNRL
jgi:antitoxin (DNA-binding transcriptional repressor) of toxin-antitoxin stability system